MTVASSPPVHQNGTSSNGKMRAIKTGTANDTAFQAKLIEGMPSMQIPYKTRLSFAPLLRHWRNKTDSPDLAERLLAREIMERAEQSPELWQPIEDPELLEQHQEFVELILSGLFPLNLRDTQLGKASKPFSMDAFFVTPAMQKTMSSCMIKVKMQKSMEYFSQTIAIRACAVILNQCYWQNLEVDPLVIYSVEPEGLGLLYHFKSELNMQYSEVVQTKPLKELSQDRIYQLLSNINDLDAWLEALPSDHFEIHGIVGINLVDVTKSETISRLRYELLEKDAVVKQDNIARLETLLKSYFNLPELSMGLMALDYPGHEQQNEFKYKIRYCFLNDLHDCLLHPSHGQSIYQKVCQSKELLLIEDLDEVRGKTPIELGLLAKGIRSILVAPLLNKNKDIIGILEIGTPNPYELNGFLELQFRELLSLFSTAVERSREETDNQIEAIIREKFTAIHPSVDWRFTDAAFNYLDKVETEGKKKAEVEPIAFPDVYPLYAQADIVSSSNIRNHSIQADFVDNLELIKNLLEAAVRTVDFPLLHQYLAETGHRIEELKNELKSSDESLVLEFIHQEIHPLLEEMALKDPALAIAINLYFSQLDKNFGVVYRKRKDYEESVTRINTVISEMLDHEEERAQGMISHYFEKYKTDGVQFELYAGQSLLRNGKFSQMHLRNLRLWQLLVTVDITRRMEQLKTELPMPLSTAQLVFVYGQPISIRFRMDDKRFDVDGAYNIRYEIIKKRIDKATIAGTEERLTQPGKIAIVYAAEKDRLEYLEYLTFLTRQGMIESPVEDLELSHLQGVQGLRALRVQVKFP